MPSIALPTVGRRLQTHTLSLPSRFERPSKPFDRVAFAAAHVVSDPWAADDASQSTSLDWDATMAYRRHLWSFGLGVAEAMDTAQRGAGLDWLESLELMTRTVSEASHIPGARVVCGVGTDHLAADAAWTIPSIIDAYLHQCEAVERIGGDIVLMASRALAAAARGPDDYRNVYGQVLGQLRGKAILHWLGEMFDPALAGYWGEPEHWAAMEVCLGVIEANSDKVAGIKISLLDRDKEVAMRRRLPAGCRMHTGDDFNYPDMIAGDERGHSDALLGIFDPIAPAAAAALDRLALGDKAGFHAVLAPTVPLSRHIFAAPTRHYKTGIVFIAYLNGHQNHFTMPAGQQSARGLTHLSELFRLADRAGLLRDPDMACTRMRAVLAVHGVN